MPDNEVAVRAKELTQPLDTPLTELTRSLEMLKKRPLSVATVELWVEWDAEAQRYLKAAQDGPFAKHVKSVWASARFFSEHLKRYTAPVEDGRKHAGYVFASWTREQQRKAAEERRQRELEAQRQQEQERIDHAAHLEQLGHKEEAEALIAEPLPPVSLPEMPAETKVEGVSVSTVYKVDESDPLEDGAAFFIWLAAHKEMWPAMEFKVAEWKHALTKQGMRPPGLRIREESESRHRG